MSTSGYKFLKIEASAKYSPPGKSSGIRKLSVNVSETAGSIIIASSFIFMTSAKLTFTFLSPRAFPILVIEISIIPESGADT